MAFVPATPVKVHQRPVVVCNSVKKNGLIMSASTTKERASFFFKFMESTVKDYGGLGNLPVIIGNDARSVFPQADNYVAECARRQYIAVQNGSGVYSPACIEGTFAGAAEDSRVASLAAAFRRRQVNGVRAFADYFETRRLATALVNGCNYEESLVGRFPAAAAAIVLGISERDGTCVRYASPKSKAEEYMAASVQRAASARATPLGVYNVMCNDGTTKGAAEAKRVAGLATKYRNGFMSVLVKEQRRFNQSKFARSYFSNQCNYEDGLFSLYPAVAGSMRPDTARY